MFYIVAAGLAISSAYIFNIFGIRDKINGKVHGKDKDKGPIIQPAPGVDQSSFDTAHRTGYTSATNPLGYVINIDPPKGRTVFDKAYQAITVS